MGYTDDRVELQRHRGAHPLLCPAGREPRNLAAHRHQSPGNEGALSAFASIEFCLWDAQDDATNFQRNFNTGQVEVEDGVIYHKTEYRERRNHFAYFACSEPGAGFDTQREAFLGRYRGWDKPAAVEAGQLTNSIAHGWSPMGAHQVKLELEPGERRGRSSLCSATTKIRRTRNSIRRVRRPSTRSGQAGDRQVSRRRNMPTRRSSSLREYWESLLGIFQVDTPDVHTNRMVNIWNAYQCMATFNMSRSASFYESGIGRGLGFRDSNQDLLGFVHMVPARARERILDLAATQLPTGGAYHQYQPLTKRGNNDMGGGLQRRSALADRRGVGVSEGDRRLEHSGRAGAVRQRAGFRAAAL